MTEKTVQFNPLDLIIDALIDFRDNGTIITFMKLPKSIRKLIVSSSNEKGDDFKSLWSFGLLWPGIHWTFNEEPMTDKEQQIEKYLKTIITGNNDGVMILLKQTDFDECLDMIREITELDIEPIGF